MPHLRYFDAKCDARRGIRGRGSAGKYRSGCEIVCTCGYLQARIGNPGRVQGVVWRESAIHTGSMAERRKKA
jgi:hypothetical protein